MHFNAFNWGQIQILVLVVGIQVLMIKPTNFLHILFFVACVVLGIIIICKFREWI